MGLPLLPGLPIILLLIFLGSGLPIPLGLRGLPIIVPFIGRRPLIGLPLIGRPLIGLPGLPGLPIGLGLPGLPIGLGLPGLPIGLGLPGLPIGRVSGLPVVIKGGLPMRPPPFPGRPIGF